MHTATERALLIVAPHGNDTWIERVSKYVALDEADFALDYCFTHGRPVAERVALRRLYARGARKIVVMRLQPAPDGWPVVRECYRVCDCCLRKIVNSR